MAVTFNSIPISIPPVIEVRLTVGDKEDESTQATSESEAATIEKDPFCCPVIESLILTSRNRRDDSPMITRTAVPESSAIAKSIIGPTSFSDKEGVRTSP